MNTNNVKSKTKPAGKQPNSAKLATAASPKEASGERKCSSVPLPNPISAAEFLQEYREQQTRRERQRQRDTQSEASASAITTVMGGSSVADAKSKPHQMIKLGIDVHLDRYVVVRQIDGGAPQPAQRFSPAEFLKWAQKQRELAQHVSSCYEAGPFGYSLHRKLSSVGVTNYVVRPRGVHPLLGQDAEWWLDDQAKDAGESYSCRFS
jgi:hypothetical protein